jgi:hypothetical protein
MKYKQLKHLRSFDDKPHEGDYVLMHSESGLQFIKEYVESTIGRIKSISYDAKSVIVTYENYPPELKTNFKNGRQFDFSFILHYSKKKEDLERILIQKKYNL